MNDSYTYLSGELRHLASRKETENSTWQDAIMQQRVTDIESRLGKFANFSSLADIAKVLVFKFNRWRQTHHQATALVTHFPSQPKTG